jgi:hypothetical protein
MIFICILITLSLVAVLITLFFTSKETYIDPQKIKIGFMYVCYDSPKNVDDCLNSVRKHYKDEPIVLVSDGGLNFESIAQKYNCQYIHDKHNNINYTKGDFTEWYKKLYNRYINTFNNMDVDYIIRLEDDVRCIRPLTKIPKRVISGPSNIKNPLKPEIIQKLKKKGIKNNLWYNCGGCRIYDKEKWLSICKKVLSEGVPFTIQELCLSRGIADDFIDGCVLLYFGGSNGNVPGIYDIDDKDKYKCPLWNNIDKWNNKLEFIHKYKKLYDNKDNFEYFANLAEKNTIVR